MTFSEILSRIARYTNTQNTTSSSFTTAEKTSEINSAVAAFFEIANKAAGNITSVDDTNHKDYPVIYQNIVSGQQDYTFLYDENYNEILSVDKVRIKNLDGVTWTTLDQIDKDESPDSYLDGYLTGRPERYFITANGIFLVEKPNYSGTAEMEIHISRAGSQFVSTDTTKRPGFPSIFHEFLVFRPTYFYLASKGLAQKNDFKLAMDTMEKNIKSFYGRKNQSKQPQFTSEFINPF